MKGWPLVVVLLAACGAPGSQQVRPDAASGSGSADAAIPDGWTTLVSRSWQLDPGATNDYECTRIQVPTDMWISGFRLLRPLGTHHALLTVDPNDTQTGDFRCNATTGTFGGQLLYAGGAGTDDLMFPEGVAVHLTAGQWINLNLHLFDATDGPLTGESGVLVKVIPEDQVVHEADMVFSGTENIDIPSDGLPHHIKGGCVAPADWHVLALWPHMHELGTHQALIVNHAGVVQTMLDTDYQFTEQKNYPMAGIVFHQGDQIQTDCTYVNTTGSTVTYGDSSTGEMCFTGIYKYPAGGSIYSCVPGVQP